MTFKINKRIDNSEPLRVWFWSLVVVLFICIFSYGFCVRGAIVNIVDRQSMESELAALNSKVLNLESEYIKAKNAVTLEKAYSLGFIAVSDQKFVTRSAKNPGLSVLTFGL
jgi:hypothetical protein